METQQFYNSLKIVPSFREVADPDFYTPVPDDWYIALTDVRGSTDAIRLGRYKEVNMAGASIIAALNNFHKQRHLLPYLFGGDGSFILLPDQHIDQVRGILSFCRQAVRDAFGLDLAIGLMSVREIREAGHDISLARLRLSEYMDQTVFWGSGITFAESYIKEQDTLRSKPIVADFTGLECRWSQIPSDKEEVAVYLIQAQAEDGDEESAKIYEECFQQIDRIYGTGNEFHPLRETGMRLTANPRLLGVEWRLRTQPPSFGRRLKYAALMAFQFVSGLYLMGLRKSTAETRWGEYRKDLVRHADYRKFGDGLRFIANGTIQQRLDLCDYLESRFKMGRLAYGAHSSFAAIITCYVRNYQSNHVHFVDGTDGGYAKASQELKHRRGQLHLRKTGAEAGDT
ncbi:MAG: DUF3095 family protein [Pseudohongiellaceae bacterium]